MKRTIAVGLVLAMASLGPVASSTASPREPNVSPSTSEMAQLDYEHGDRNDRWGDHARSSADLEGRWIAKQGYSMPPRWRGNGIQKAALPPRLVIDQRRNVIRLEDFQGRLLQEIVIRSRGGASNGGAVLGQWQGSKLLTVRSGNHDTRIVQTFALENRGHTLVVHTQQDGRGTRHDVEFTNVYQRA